MSVTVPSGFVVGASGREQQRTDDAGETTYRFRGEDIHDFAWTASPRFIESRKWHGPIEMRLLLQPEHASQAERHFRATGAALRGGVPSIVVPRPVVSTFTRVAPT